MPKRSYVAPRPDIPLPSMVRDTRFPDRWGVLRRWGRKAGFVQFGPSIKTDLEHILNQHIAIVTQEEIDARIAEVAAAQEAEDLV
jgi:hypothetical protein